MFDIRELDGDQRRRFVDTRDLFEAYEHARNRYDHECSGHMRWVQRRGRWYLHHKHRNQEKSLGVQSEETLHIYQRFQATREELRERLRTLARRIDAAAPVNRALNLPGLPKASARIVRELNKAGIGGRNVHVVGTNALYAYEAMSGVRLPRDVLSTADTDLLFDGRRNLTLLANDMRVEGLVGILRNVDKSFTPKGAHSFCAVNDAGLRVDLITPETRYPWRKGVARRIGESAGDLAAAPIEGLDWLIHAPKVAPVVLDDRGYPLRMPTIDPRVFALHKAWLSRRGDRDPVKAARDWEQAEVAAALATHHLGLQFDDEVLGALPKPLRAFKDAILSDHPGDRGDPDITPGW